MLAATFSLVAAAQAQINTRKVKISDFTAKTLKVILPGHPVLDEALRAAVNGYWGLSPFEICRSDAAPAAGSGLYSLGLETAVKDSTLLELCLRKEASGDERQMELARLPLCPLEPSGNEAALLPALLTAFQTFVQKAFDSDFASVGSAFGNIGEVSRYTFCFRKEDLPQGYVPTRGISTLTGAELEDLLLEGGENVVGYVICSPGGSCFRIMVDALEYRIVYFASHRVSRNNPAGFLPSDLRAVEKVKKKR